MNQLVKDVILKMAVPVVQAILKDIITGMNLKELREEVISWAVGMAHKTETNVDDKMLEVLIPILFTPEHTQEFLKFLLPKLREFVKDSSTQWDDVMFLPILDVLEVSFN